MIHYIVFPLTYLDKRQILLRYYNEPENISLSPNGEYIAHVEQDPQGQKSLVVTSLREKKETRVDRIDHGLHYFWAPHGFRLMYKKTSWDQGKAHSYIYGYDVKLKKIIKVSEIPVLSGYISISPFDFVMRILNEDLNIINIKLNYPGSRLAKWQENKKLGNYQYLFTRNKVLRMSTYLSSLKELKSDSSPISSYSVSPDGTQVVWATEKNNIYMVNSDEKVKFVDRGRHPVWHPKSKSILYAGGRVLGYTVVRYDLKIMDRFGRKIWLTQTQSSDEKWPTWSKKANAIIYSIDRTTDLYLSRIINDKVSKNTVDKPFSDRG